MIERATPAAPGALEKFEEAVAQVQRLNDALTKRVGAGRRDTAERESAPYAGNLKETSTPFQPIYRLVLPRTLTALSCVTLGLAGPVLIITALSTSFLSNSAGTPPQLHQSSLGRKLEGCDNPATRDLSKTIDERVRNTGIGRTSICRDMSLLPTKEAHSVAISNAPSAQNLTQALASFPDPRDTRYWPLDPWKEPRGHFGIWQVRQADAGSANANLFASEVIQGFGLKGFKTPDTAEAHDRKHARADVLIDLASARHQIELLETHLEAALRLEEKAVAAAALLADELIVLRKQVDELTSAPAVTNGKGDEVAALIADLTFAHEEIATLRAGAASVQLEAERALETAQVKAAQRMKEFDSERERSASLSHELASLREHVEAMELKAAAATTAQEQAMQAAVAATSERQRILDEERAKVAALSADLAAAREETGATRANAASAQLGAARAFEAALATAARRGGELDRERERAAAAAKELASLNEKLEETRSRAAAATTTKEDTAQAAQAAVTAAAELQQTLNEERARVAALSADLAGARKEIAAREANAAAAQVGGARALEAAQAEVAHKREELEYERGRAADLVSQLAAAREEIEVLRASFAATAERARLHEQYAKSEGDWKRSSGLGSAAAGQELDALKKRITALEAQADPPAAAREAHSRTLSASNRPEPSPTASQLPALQATNNLARAGALIQQGDIKGAQLVLEREVTAGSAQAAFALAETYDPRMLSSWRTVGIRGNPSKARELYQRADEGGIQEARRRADALK